MKVRLGKSAEGSVLMETVLVLPLLLLVFGGLFVLGDVIHGRLHLSTVDRMAAWTPESRFECGHTNIVARTFRFLGLHTALILEKAYSDWYDSGDEKQLRCTEWLDFTGGRAYARTEVPIWAAMANTHNVVNGAANGESLSSTWRYHVRDGVGSPVREYADFDRQYVVRRTPDTIVSADSDQVRTVNAAELGWFSIPLGDWPDGDRGLFFGAKLPSLPYRHPFVRHPVALAVGE